MAEVLGIVASGIAVGQLASEVTSSIIKLKGYWDQVKDAPGEIRQLLLEIDSLNLILSHIEQDQNRAGLSELSQKICVEQSLKLCKQGVEELTGLVSELAVKIDGKTGWRRKAGASKVVLKREEVKKLKRRMKNAIRLLSLAYQCHTNAMIRLQPDVIVARISDKMNSISKAVSSGSCNSSYTTPELQDISDMTKEETSAAENYNLINALYHVWILSPSRIKSLIGSLQYSSGYEISKGRQTLEVRARYRCPSWLSNRAWDARYLSETSGWKIYLQTHPVLPWNHDIFVFAKTGNITSLRSMLVESRSYVAARQDTGGRTPLHVAATQGQLEVCKLLLDAGADPSAEDDIGFTTIQETCHFTPQNAGDDSMAIDLCRLLINAGASGSELLHCQIEHDNDRCQVYSWYHGSPALFQFLQRQIYPRCHELPIKDRLELIKAINFWQNESALDIFRLALGTATFNREMLAATDDDGRTVLHWIGSALSDTKCTGLKWCHISGQAAGYLLRHRPCHSSNHCGWSALLRDVLSAGSLLHVVDNEGNTPLCELLSRFFNLSEKTEYWNRDAKMIQYLSCTLYTWIYDLNASGIDLQQYGELETALGLKDEVNSSRRLNFREERFHILGFSYGPMVEDWKFWFSEPTDYLAGEFWTMIEKSPSHSDSHCTIPGSWPEDIESDSESD